MKQPQDFTGLPNPAIALALSSYTQPQNLLCFNIHVRTTLHLCLQSGLIQDVFPLADLTVEHKIMG
jgi:hypothetical protein